MSTGCAAGVPSDFAGLAMTRLLCSEGCCPRPALPPSQVSTCRSLEGRMPGVPTTRVIVTARDRRGKALALPALRATYEEATSSRAHRPALQLEIAHGGTHTPAEALGS